MDLKVVPLLSSFNYFEWKSKMFAYIKRHCLYDVSIGAMRELDSFQEKYHWLNDNDRAYGTMCLAIPHTMCYLLDFFDYPLEICRNIDEALGIQQEDVSCMESKKMGISLCVLPPMISASYIPQEDVRNAKEEVAKDSTNDPTQVSSFVDSSPYKEAIFHEDSI